MKTADVIVLGVGGMGSAACWHLAKRGAKVVGIEQYEVGHAFGSSHGETRMIRQAYFEHEDYVPLLKRAYELWDELSELSKRKLFRRVGVLYVGTSDSAILKGVQKSAEIHHLNLVEISPSELAEEYAGISLPRVMSAWLEPDAGYLEVENCVIAHLNQARKAGAEIIEHEKVVDWSVEKGCVRVKTTRKEFEASRLVIAGGAWRNEKLGTRLPIQVHRNVVAWFPADERYEVDNGMPCFGFDLPEGFLYGFPQISASGMKAAIHKPGSLLTDPEKVDRKTYPEDTRSLIRAVGRVFPGVKTSPSKASVCFYCLSPDENFIIDHHPEHPEVAIAAGFSGHGFKFCSVVGEALADLTLQGRTYLPINFLGLKRFQ